MTRIYIRHSEKTYRNGQNETFKHDPPITEEGKVQAQQLAHLLIQKFGVPGLIMCSPYRRTRETAEAMRDSIGGTNFQAPQATLPTLPSTGETNLQVPQATLPEIRCDNLLSEYLGNHEETDVTNETASFAPPHHDESLGAFKARIRKHNALASVLDDLTQPVWFITHGFIMSTLADIMGSPVGNYPNRNKQRHPFRKIRPLGCLYIEKTPNTETVTKAVLLRFPSLYRQPRSNPSHLGTIEYQQNAGVDCPPQLIPASDPTLNP